MFSKKRKKKIFYQQSPHGSKHSNSCSGSSSLASYPGLTSSPAFPIPRFYRLQYEKSGESLGDLGTLVTSGRCDLTCPHTAVFLMTCLFASHFTAPCCVFVACPQPEIEFHIYAVLSSGILPCMGMLLGCGQVAST